MRGSLIAVFLFLSFFCSGQWVRFNPIIKSSEDAATQAIAQLWENYLISLRENQSDSIQKTFWHNQSDDLLKNFHSGLLSTFNIRKHSDTIYEIYSQQLLGTPENFDIFSVYKVCAIKRDNTFKLLNYFDVHKYALQNYNTENIAFYYSCGFPFDVEKTIATEDFIRQFQKDYKLKKRAEKII